MLKPVDARFLLWLYPARWRAEYGEELRGMLLSKPASAADIFDVVLHAARENVRRPDPSTAGFLFMVAWRGLWICCNQVSVLAAPANRADPWVYYLTLAVLSFLIARREQDLWRGYRDAYQATFMGYMTADIGFLVLLPPLHLPPTMLESHVWVWLLLGQFSAFGGGIAGRYMRRKTA